MYSFSSFDTSLRHEASFLCHDTRETRVLTFSLSSTIACIMRYLMFHPRPNVVYKDQRSAPTRRVPRVPRSNSRRMSYEKSSYVRRSKLQGDLVKLTESMTKSQQQQQQNNITSRLGPVQYKLFDGISHPDAVSRYKHPLSPGVISLYILIGSQQPSYTKAFAQTQYPSFSMDVLRSPLPCSVA